MKLAFDMTWLMKILRISLPNQLLIKNYLIKYLILTEIQVMVDISAYLLHFFISLLIKSLPVVVFKIKPNIMKFEKLKV